MAMFGADGGGAKRSKDFRRARMLGAKAMVMNGLITIWICSSRKLIGTSQNVNLSANCNWRAVFEVLVMLPTPPVAITAAGI